VIYRSDSDNDAAVRGEDDASEDLLALRVPEFRTLIPAALPPDEAFVGAARLDKFDLRVFRGTAGERVANFGFAIDSGVWRVSASHRSGSLDAAVEQVRRRNLAVSFGILALLAASVVIVLISAARAERLARQQMEFVSTVSHELRTPLAVICSAGENLADGVVRDADQLKSYGKVVHNEGRRLTEMVEQILSFAGIQAGLKKHALVPTDVPTLVDQALEALDMPIREAGFVVERRNAEPTLPVMADPVALRRAIQNLVSNVIKYSGANKWLAISVEPVGRFIKIAVQDRGIGISASDLPHIFEPFYRGRSAVEGQIQGSGLGLSLVSEIVHAHGGRIDVTSNLGEGSTFTILLPEVSS
jgi:signal transduction histidine kinase